MKIIETNVCQITLKNMENRGLLFTELTTHQLLCICEAVEELTTLENKELFTHCKCDAHEVDERNSYQFPLHIIWRL